MTLYEFEHQKLVSTGKTTEEATEIIKNTEEANKLVEKLANKWDTDVNKIPGVIPAIVFTALTR